MNQNKFSRTIASRRKTPPVATPSISAALLASLTDASDLFDVFAVMALDNAVVPGEPIPVSFQFWTWNNELDLGTGWSLKVYYNEMKHGSETMIFQLPSDGSFLPYRLKWIPGQLHPRYDIGTRDAIIDIGDTFAPGTNLADSLYQFGAHVLRVEFTTNGTNAGPFSATATLEVVPESNIGSWWQWDPNAPPGANWKENYQLSGSIRNGSSYVGMDFTLELVETDEANNERSIATSEQDLFNSGSASLTFPPISQDWPWLVQGVWTPETSETGKLFEYAVNVSALDKYGNVYPAAKSPEHGVEINVSDKKLGLAFNAFQAQASAIGLTIAAAAAFLLPPLAAALAAAATAAGIAAQVLGGLALDPPKPNKRYLRAVRIQRRPVFDTKFSSQPVAAIGEFFEHVTQAGACLVALSETQSRILGAQRDKSEQGLSVQSHSLRKIFAEMMALSAMLPTASAAAAEVFRRHYASQLASALTSNIKPTMRRRIGKVAVTKSVKEAINPFLREPAARKKLGQKQTLPLMFTAISRRLALLLKQYASD